MSIAIANSADSWTNALSDPGVKAEVQALAADGVLSYGDLLQILSDLASRGPVTAAEFSDLKTIAANLNIGVSTPADAAAAFIQLVDGNPANAYWNGGAATATALGYLGVGTSATDLDELIGKWFLGADMPDPTTPSGVAYEPTAYASFSDPLYGSTGAPTVNDVAQGEDGDCELCAAMIDMVVENPTQLESTFVNDGNGVYSVRFYIGGNEIWETVNDELPVVSGSTTLVYNNAYDPSDQAFWADLLEKAYAQLAETGEIGDPPQNAYASIYGLDSFQVLNNLTDASSVNYYKYDDANWSADKAIFLAALASDEDLILESEGVTHDSNGDEKLVSDHAFAVVGYDPDTGDFIVRNPWGLTGAGYDVQFEVSMSDIAGVEGDVAVDNSTQTALRVLTIAEGWQNGVWAEGTEYVSAASSAPVSSWFTTVDASGASATEYMFQVAGPGSINLNGATNLATAAQQAKGQYFVSASDLAKVRLTGAAAGSDSTLIVRAYDGATWSAATDIAVTFANAPLVVVPKLETTLDPSGVISIASLFQVDGAVNPRSGAYQIEISSGGGAINLNGATNWGSGGAVDVSADDFPWLTFAAPSVAGATTLEVDVYNGSEWSDFQTVEVVTGASAAGAIQDYDNGRLGNAGAVADSAANISANLDGLQTMLAAGVLDSVLVSDSAAIGVDTAQLTSDAGVISDLTNADGAPYQLAITDTAAAVAADASALKTLIAAGRVATLTRTGVTGQAYTAHETVYDAVGNAIAQIYSGVSGEPYSSFEYDYAGGALVGSKFFYAGIADEPYTAEELDYDGAGRVTRAAFSGVTGAPYSSYEYDYVGGVFAGSKFTYTTTPQEASYSSCEVDYNQANVVAGLSFYFPDVTGEPYVSEEVDYDANLQLSRVVLTGVQDEAYSSLEYDYSAGTYEGYKAYYAITNQSFANEEVDVSASGRLEKVVYSGMMGASYQTVEQDFSGGLLDDVIYGYTDVTGQTYNAYQVMENAGGVGLTETFDLNNGGHALIALAGGQTLTSLGNDKMTGSSAGSTTFVLDAVYGADVIANFNSSDAISLPTNEFANFAAVMAAATQSGASVVLTAPDGDTLTLKNLTTTALGEMVSNFTFHA